MEGDFLLDQTIRKIQYIFYVTGINIKCGKQTPSLKSTIIYIMSFFFINVNALAEVYWLIDGIKNGKDFLELTYVAPCVIINILGNAKTLCLITNGNHVNYLLDNLKKLETVEKERMPSVERNGVVEQERNFLNIVLFALNVLYVVLVITSSVAPILLIVLKYYQTGDVELTLPLLVLYPFDPFQMKVWPFIYMYHFWIVCVVCLDVCAADYFFFTCCTYIRIQFRLLQRDLENVFTIDYSFNKNFVDDEEFQKKFKELIKWHQDLIQLAKVLEIIYSKSTLANFLSSSLIICLTGFNVTMVNDVASVVTFVSFLFIGMMQIFFLCFFADLLMISSLEIDNAVYNSKWYMAEAKIRKKLLFVQTRAQKPCKITALGFADVTLKSFMRILSTSWSYFALLQTMYGNYT